MKHDENYGAHRVGERRCFDVGSWPCDVPGKNLLVLEHHGSGFSIFYAVFVHGGGEVFLRERRAVDELDVPVQEFGVGRGESDAATHLSGVRPYFPRLGPVQQKLQPTVVQLQSARWPRVRKRLGCVVRRDVGAVPGWCWKASWSRTRRQRVLAACGGLAGQKQAWCLRC